MTSILLASLVTITPAHAAGDDPDLTTLLHNISELVANIDRYLVKLSRTRNAAQIGAGLIEVIRQYPFVDLLWLENRFRQLKTETYLVGQPTAFLPSNVCAMALWPMLPEPDFTLWIGTRGHDEMLDQLKAFGIASEAENRDNLMRTGFASLKDVEPPVKH